MEVLESTEVTMSKALSVVLQHPAVAADQQNICRLLQVCRSWRSAVQQSTACITDVAFRGQLPSDAENKAAAATADFAAKLARFAHWLPKCAGTIRSIELDIVRSRTSDATTSSLRELAQHVLSLGLMAARHTGHVAPTPGCSSAVSAALAPGTVMPPPLNLRSFTCCRTLASPAIVSALPAATLTQLEIQVPQKVQIHEALRSLSGLRSLHLDSADVSSLSEEYLSSISQLSKLTYLLLYPLQGSSGLALLPQQLIKLDLCIYSREGQPVILDLFHLTQLQQLYADVKCHVEAAHLPKQLQLLNITYCNAAVLALDITSLQQLQQLSINGSKDTSRDLLALKQMQSLEAIELSYKDMARAIAAAPAWLQLPSLTGMCLTVLSTYVQMAAALEGLQQLPQLTRLELSCKLQLDVVDDEDDDDADAGADAAVMLQLSEVCHSLKHLTRLQALKLELTNWPKLQAEDVLHLSALTNLTQLQLHLSRKVDSTTAIAVLLELTGLQHLALCDLEEMYALPVIGKLQGLTCLSLPQLPEQQQQQGLKHLSRLRKLQSLTGFTACSREDLHQMFPNLQA